MTEGQQKEEITAFKILLLGDSQVGKTSFILRFCDDKFQEESLTTIGLDTKNKFIKIKDKKIQLNIWDTAGEERFRSIAKNSFKGAHGILLMYGIDDKKSFRAIKDWINSIKESIDINKIGLVVVGNKCDIKEEQKEVDQEMMKNLEEKEKVEIIIASAKDNINVNESFIKLIEKMMKLGLGNVKKVAFGEDDDEVGGTKKLKSQKNNKKNNNNCCKK